MRVKFKENRVTKEVQVQTFEKDKEYDLPETSARHWINRGVAVEVVTQPVASVEKKIAPPIHTASKGPIKEV